MMEDSAYDDHEVANDAHVEMMEDDEIDDDRSSLVWVKLASTYWPARLIRSVDGELSEIELFDGTKKTMEHIKLKPFEKLAKIPTKRSKIWKNMYALALKELE